MCLMVELFSGTWRGWTTGMEPPLKESRLVVPCWPGICYKKLGQTDVVELICNPEAGNPKFRAVWVA